MNWTKILSDSGTPESPGREEAARMKRYRALFRDKYTGVESEQIIEAMSLYGAMRQIKSKTKVLFLLTECLD